METITLKEYEKIPILFNYDTINRNIKLKVGDYYVMREPDDFIERGQIVSVYEVIRLTETGDESKITMLRIE